MFLIGNRPNYSSPVTTTQNLDIVDKKWKDHIKMRKFLPALYAFNIAQPSNAGIPATGTGDDLLQTIIKNSITIIFTVAAILVTAMLLWGAIEWISSGGDKEKLSSARKRIMQALIGLIILALAFVILKIISGIVGINILEGLNLPSLGAQ